MMRVMKILPTTTLEQREALWNAVVGAHPHITLAAETLDRGMEADTWTLIPGKDPKQFVPELYTLDCVIQNLGLDSKVEFVPPARVTTYVVVKVVHDAGAEPIIAETLEKIINLGDGIAGEEKGLFGAGDAKIEEVKKL